MTDGNFGKVSAGVLFPKSRFNQNGGNGQNNYFCSANPHVCNDMKCAILSTRGSNFTFCLNFYSVFSPLILLFHFFTQQMKGTSFFGVTSPLPPLSLGEPPISHVFVTVPVVVATASLYSQKFQIKLGSVVQSPIKLILG